ncbi:Rieske 2Fe-2S domain-containing protein [Brevundimonas kwangchunensis]|uniref:Rieske 2Fe-2S domain-containing protein n=1 Tax=Brevundimonas kwangchunensis TaxID=322163 RepID=A0ABP3S2E5_9CAUL
MTPLPESIARSWQMAALSRELKSQPLARTVADTSLVLFRDEAGGAVALIDRCPHRNYPLSEGRLVDGTVQCPYHGWRFGADGACVDVPGCTLDGDERQRLAARPVEAREIHGAVLVRLQPGGPELPDLGPWGAADHDHFWWSQGVWRGRALDALENVLDPFHTNFIHDGIIRRSNRRIPVRLSVETGEDWIESIIEQPRPDMGWMSRMLEPPRDRSRTRLYSPTLVQARWEGPRGLTLCVTVFFTPVTPTTLAPFACFTTPKGRGPGWLKERAIRFFLEKVVAQDRHALARQLDNIERFGAPRFLQGPGDLLGARVAQLYQGQKIEPAREGPFDFEL